MSNREARLAKRRDRQIRRAGACMNRVMERGACLFCSEPAGVLGAWEVPDDIGRRLMVAPGKLKVYFYMLCPEHARTPFDEIEGYIFERERRRLAQAGPSLN